jgi:hypothetical protein
MLEEVVNGKKEDGSSVEVKAETCDCALYYVPDLFIKLYSSYR